MKKLLIAFLCPMLLLSVAVTPCFSVCASETFKVESGETLDITDNAEFYTLTVSGTAIIHKNASVSLKDLIISDGGALTVEEGAVLSINKGRLYLLGNLTVGGRIDGSIVSIYTSRKGSIHIDAEGSIVVVCGSDLTEWNEKEKKEWESKIGNAGANGAFFGRCFVALGSGHTHSFENGICAGCGAIDCVIGEKEHSYQDGACTVCGKKGCASHTFQNGVCTVCGLECSHKYSDTNVCSVCGAHRCDIEGHVYSNGRCTRCSYVCQNGFHRDSFQCPECGMTVSGSFGSVFSKGSTTIICTVAAAVVFGICGFLLGRKRKKPATANGTVKKPEEEE